MKSSNKDLSKIKKRLTTNDIINAYQKVLDKYGVHSILDRLIMDSSNLISEIMSFRYKKSDIKSLLSIMVDVIILIEQISQLNDWDVDMRGIKEAKLRRLINYIESLNEGDLSNG